MKRGWRKGISEILFRLFAALTFRALGAFLALAQRLLDDPLLDDRLRRPGPLEQPAPDRSGRRRGSTGRAVGRSLGPLPLRRAGSRGRGPPRGGGNDGPAARATGGRALASHERAALVADSGGDGVERPAGGARLRPHLPHLFFLPKPVLVRQEGRLLAPPLLELALREAASQLSRGLFLEPADDLVVLEAHLLLVVRHLELTR